MQTYIKNYKDTHLVDSEFHTCWAGSLLSFFYAKALTEMDDRYGNICQFHGWFLDLTPTPMRNELMARQCCNKKAVVFFQSEFLYCIDFHDTDYMCS